MSILRFMACSSPARRFRVKAFLLLAVFLAAGTSLPSLDALAHHRDGAEGERSQAHIETAGGCRSHAAHCALGRTAAGSGAGLLLSATSPLASDSRPAAPWLPTHILLSTDRGGSPQSRAPPTPPA